MNQFKYIFLNEHGTKFEGPTGPKCSLRVMIDVPSPKDASAVISHLNSPTFRAELEGLKPQLGLSNYGMDVGRLIPHSEEINGQRVPVRYEREIKLTRSI